MDNQNTANLLKSLRKTAGLTQEYVANILDISRPKYVSIESGNTELSLSEIKNCRSYIRFLPQK